MPRVEELIIITEHSPWCTTVKNPQGVTLGDICGTLYKEYVPKSLPVVLRAFPFSIMSESHSNCVFVSVFCRYGEKMVTEKEFDSLPTRLQEQVRRYAASSANQSWQQYYSPQPTPTQFRRVGESAIASPRLGECMR